MKKLLVMVLVVISLVAISGIASAFEHGNVGGIGTTIMSTYQFSTR